MSTNNFSFQSLLSVAKKNANNELIAGRKPISATQLLDTVIHLTAVSWQTVTAKDTATGKPIVDESTGEAKQNTYPIFTLLEMSDRYLGGGYVLTRMVKDWEEQAGSLDAVNDILSEHPLGIIFRRNGRTVTFDLVND